MLTLHFDILINSMNFKMNLISQSPIKSLSITYTAKDVNRVI
jgi:hypothetical protein